MTATTAIALCRSLWPAVTAEAASDAMLTAWYPWATGLAGSVFFGDLQEMAVAHLLAHAAYRVDPAGLIPSSGTGSLQSATTSRRSVSWGSMITSVSVALVDADLSTTRPGMAYLTLRDSRPGRLPEVF